MKAEEFLKRKYPNGCNEHSQFGYDELVNNMTEFADLKLKEQRRDAELYEWWQVNIKGK